MAFKAAPLSNGFMVASMLGFIISAVYWSFGRISETWGFTFCLVFVMMFIASMVSMTKAPVPDELQIDTARKKKK